ncbi:Adagio protein [Dirofilaria immitis]
MNKEDINISIRIKPEFPIMVDESKGLLSLEDEMIIRIFEKLNSEDMANIADTCIRLREIVRKMATSDESLSDFSIESIDELELDCI